MEVDVKILQLDAVGWDLQEVGELVEDEKIFCAVVVGWSGEAIPAMRPIKSSPVSWEE